MAKHHIVGDESPFLKRVLIPFWVVRDIIMLLEMALYGLAIGAIAAAKQDLDDELSSEDGTTASVTTAIAILAVILVIIIACLVLDIVCIIKRSRRTLTPPFFLGVNIAQTVVWTILFILSMIGARTGVTILIGVIVYLSFVGLLIYASVVYHRYRKGALRGAYTPAVNPAVNPYQQGFVYNTAGDISYPNASYGYYSEPSHGQYEMQAQPVQPHGYPTQYGQ